MITLRSKESPKDVVSFCLLTEYEIKKKYEIDKIHFGVSVYFIDEYFDYTTIRRDKKLNSLGYER